MEKLTPIIKLILAKGYKNGATFRYVVSSLEANSINFPYVEAQNFWRKMKASKEPIDLIAMEEDAKNHIKYLESLLDKTLNTIW